MRPAPKLALKKETLARLDAEQLARVAGAGISQTCPHKCDLSYDFCLSGAAWCASIFDPCITWGLCTTY